MAMLTVGAGHAFRRRVGVSLLRQGDNSTNRGRATGAVGLTSLQHRQPF